jgi:signal transduction histidine kinase
VTAPTESVVRRRIARLSIAVMATVGAIAGKLALDLAVAPSVWLIVLFIAVLIAAWVGGVAAGIGSAVAVMLVELLGIFAVPGAPPRIEESAPALELTSAILAVMLGLVIRATRVREQVSLATVARVSREAVDRGRRWQLLTSAVVEFAAVRTPLQASDLLARRATELAGGRPAIFLPGAAPPAAARPDAVAGVPDAVPDDPLYVPVVGEAGPIGVLRVTASVADDEVIAGLLALSRLAGAALDRIRLRTDSGSATRSAERSGDRLDRLQALTTDLAAAITPDSIGEAVVRHALDALAAPVGLFYVVDGGGDLRLAHGRGYPIGLAGHDARLPPTLSLPSTDAARTGDLVVIASPEAWRAAYPGASDRLAITGTRSVIAYPLGRPPRGVLVIQRGTDGEPSEDDLSFLAAVNHQATQALERASMYANEREARQLQEAFVGVISHELRTPITTILAGSKLMGRDRGLNAIGRELATDIEAEADRLYRLVEDLLVISRLERGNLAVGDEPVLVGRVAQRVVTSEAARWPATHFELQAEPAGDLVRGDETYVEQVLRNLLTNAAKYSPAGSTVTVRVERSGESVAMRVLDQGPGVTSAEVEQLFSLFYRSPATSASAAGAGIGLFVCRRLVDAMGGRVWARQRPEGGSEFGFSLGAYPEEEVPDDELEPPASGEDSRPDAPEQRAPEPV